MTREHDAAMSVGLIHSCGIGCCELSQRERRPHNREPILAWILMFPRRCSLSHEPEPASGSVASHFTVFYDIVIQWMELRMRIDVLPSLLGMQVSGQMISLEAGQFGLVP